MKPIEPHPFGSNHSHDTGLESGGGSSQQAARGQVEATAGPPSENSLAPAARTSNRAAIIEQRRWWLKLFLQPLLFVLAGALLMAGLGLAQRLGWISAGAGSAGSSAGAGQATSYICPMMCTPPQSEPGRCPVCAMELVPATSSGAGGDQSLELEPAARRLANVSTVAVRSRRADRQIRTLGELSYDEGSLKTIAAYAEGRLEKLYADFTGMVVRKGASLAEIYSPKLYSAQVEYLLAQRAPELAENARERLIELGMTGEQIEELRRVGRASSRLKLLAPNHGTVIEKLAVEGQYLKEGEPIYRLADLSTLWLMLRLFPEDAAAIRYGQRVEARVQSLPGRQFLGRVAFVDPQVDPQTRTVGVRVVIPNEHGWLRAGDFADALIEVPLGAADGAEQRIYDPELASQWISPRHPHVILAEPGSCPVCGDELIPASQLGFTDSSEVVDEVLVLPRDAVLMAGDNSVVYAETEPGRFELRQVVLGPFLGEQIVILDGVQEGEKIAVRGNFLIDSQMQLAGNPSLIDPTRFQPREEPPSLDPAEQEKIMLALANLPEHAAKPVDSKVAAALAELSETDRELALRQRICPVAKMPLGSMGTPPKVEVQGGSYFICCEGCRQRLLDEPEKYLANLGGRGQESANDR